MMTTRTLYCANSTEHTNWQKYTAEICHICISEMQKRIIALETKLEEWRNQQD